MLTGEYGGMAGFRHDAELRLIAACPRELSLLYPGSWAAVSWASGQLG